MTRMNTKTLQALTKLTDKNNSRYYANGIFLDKEAERAVVSDSLTLVSVPANITEEDSVIVKRESCNIQAKVAKAQKQDSVELKVSEEDVIDGKYPPYQQAYPKSEGMVVTFSLENLKKVVDALYAIPNEDRHKLVTLTFDKSMPANRPVLLETLNGAQALIAPMRNSD